MGFKSLWKGFKGPASLTGDALVKEIRKVELVDRHWELPFRRHYLSSKEEECRSIAKSLLMYGFTQWDVNTLLCGAFIAQGILGAILLSPISVIISFFAMCCLLQLRLHRDKLTLHYSMLSFGIYIILMVNLMIVQPEHRVSYGGVNFVLATSFVHFVILSLLGRHTIGRNFERFADTCLQFQVPTVVECHAMLTGVIACLGVTFAVAHIYSLAYASLIVVLFTLFARLGFVIRPKDRQTTNATGQEEGETSARSVGFMDSCVPVVRCVLNVMFTVLSLVVSIASLVDGHMISLRKQESFKAWESANALVGEYTFSFEALTYLLSVALVIIIALQVVFLLQLVLKSPKLVKALQRRTIFMGKSCVDRKGNFYYAYYNYTVDSAGYVVDVDTIRKNQLEGYDGSLLTCYDVYLAMQRRALHALCQRSLYCHIPILQLYTAEKDSNVLVRNRVRLEKMADELEELVSQERLRRREARLERERLRRLQNALENRPHFISRSIPFGLDLGISPHPANDTFDDVRCDANSHKRTLSIPIDLSLQDVEDLPAIARMKDRLYQRRCATTSVTDDFYWRAPGIIDRVRCSWLDKFNGDPLPSGRMLKPVTTQVFRDPTKGKFNFNKIDNTLSNIFKGLEILSTSGRPIPREMGTPNSRLGQRYGGGGGGVNGNTGEGSSRNNITPRSSDVSGRFYLDVPSPSDVMSQSTRGRWAGTDEVSPMSHISSGNVKSPSSVSVTMHMPQPVQFIDIGTTKSVIAAVDMPQPRLDPYYHGDGDCDDPQRKWRWLDSTVNEVVGSTSATGANRTCMDSGAKPVASWIKNHEGDDDVVYDRIRPIEEALEGQYYVNENGQLVVKSGNRYVPVRYHGERSVKKLAAFFSTPKNQEPVKEAVNVPKQQHKVGDHGDGVDDYDDDYESNFVNVVTSPSHCSMVYTLSNDVFSRPRMQAHHPSRYIIFTDSIEEPSSPVDEIKCPIPDTRYSHDTDAFSNRSQFMLTREYEVYPPFSLDSIAAQKQAGGDEVVDDDDDDKVATTEKKVRIDASAEKESGECSTTHRETSLVEASCGGATITTTTMMIGSRGGGGGANDDDDGDTFRDASSNNIRRIAAAQHLPLALDSRHDKVYHVFPQPRQNGVVMERPKVRTDDALVHSVATTPSSIVTPHRHKINGSTGCDFTNRNTESGGHGHHLDDDGFDSTTSLGGSSVTTRSPSVTPIRPFLPKRQWRNEFDFSPVAIHTAEDVMRDLMRDVDMLVDSGADDASDVSYDFIFGR